MFKKIPINIVSAIVIFILVFAWIISGLFSSDETSSSEIIANSETVEKITVRASEFSSQDKTYYLTVRGRTEADKVVMIKPKTSSNISMVINPGQNVKAGELICLLDKENRLAGLNEANANKNKAQLQFDAIQTLANEGYRSENAVATAEAALKSAIARVEMAQNELDNIRIVAPFDGYVEDVFVEVGDLITPANPCAKIMQLDPMKVTGEVTEKNVAQLSIDQEVSVKMLNGETIEGKINFISKSANPSTRTYKVEATVLNKDGNILEGLTAEMRVPLNKVKAHLIPSYLLSLNDEGELGIKIVENEIVKFLLIQIIEDGLDGLWVSGLPDEVTIITVGQEYVINGQNVNVQLSEI